jgi:magnesium transporter
MAIAVTTVDARRRHLAPLPLERVGELANHPEVLLWLDLVEPTVEELDALGAALGLPSRAVEDALEGRQRPKIEHYADCVAVVTYAATSGVDADGAVLFEELQLLVSKRWVVTVWRTPSAAADRVRARVLGPDRPAASDSTTSLAYAVLDEVVDGYFGVLEELQERIERVDETVWAQPDDADLSEAFALRRDLARFMREVLTVMVRREGGVLDDSIDEDLRDLYDHVITVHEEIEMSRELLSAALEAHMSVVSNRLNEVVLKVSAWAAIIAVPTVIASIYGMNFRDMPELRWAFGYPFAVALMIACAVGLYLTFKRQRWL